MKLKSIFLSTLALTIISCSSDDEFNGNINQPDNNTFLPLTNENYWVYEVSSLDGIQRDSIYVNGDKTINGQTYKEMKAREPFMGFYASAVHNNGVREADGKLFLSGSLSAAGLEDFFDINLSLNDFIVFDENANNNQQLSVVSDEFEQEFEGFPVTISYSLRSFAQNEITNFSASNGQTYASVKPMKTVLRIKVTTSIELIPGFPPVNFDVLNEQDLVSSMSYFVQEIGVVQTDTNYQYQINPQLSSIPGFGGLPFPESGSSTITEKLLNFNIN
jgi:hypothetical protein